MERKRVVATGVFDLLHPGHIHFLRAARELGDELVVIVANDATVRRMKREPIVSATVRAEMVASLKPVDQAIVGREGNMLDIVVEEIKPHIIALGHDQDMFEPKALEAKLAERGHVVQVVRLPKLEHGLAGTRKIVARILRDFGQE
ncbi:MAG: adenylyltransferase/cytidyltransferase family protein [Candidatus Thermoplasmatota archaeon]|nr:adenylyltransferase/cytidyltransferase family protein [Candidatus Thermoplasmatota archaeon]MEC9336347.1 adenylyltransferase/cytidyltransferase family protein [Candidatus Thermoplasmatota archaeon]